MPVQFKELFRNPKPIIGMIHLTGKNRQEKIDRAVEEMRIYGSFGVDGAIIEDYFGDERDLENALNATRNFNRIVRGVNYLKNQYLSPTYAASVGAKFVQIDSMPTNAEGIERLRGLRDTVYTNIAFLGGVQFKYQKPSGLPLEEELKIGMENLDAIVTTGSETGVETPIEKLRAFKAIMRDFPLIVGAGLTADNAEEQLAVADAAIVGSYFKYDGKAANSVDPQRVARLMRLRNDMVRR